MVEVTNHSAGDRWRLRGLSEFFSAHPRYLWVPAILAVTALVALQIYRGRGVDLLVPLAATGLLLACLALAPNENPQTGREKARGAVAELIYFVTGALITYYVVSIGVGIVLTVREVAWRYLMPPNESGFSVLSILRESRWTLAAALIVCAIGSAWFRGYIRRLTPLVAARNLCLLILVLAWIAFAAAGATTIALCLTESGGASAVSGLLRPDSALFQLFLAPSLTLVAVEAIAAFSIPAVISVLRSGPARVVGGA